MGEASEERFHEAKKSAGPGPGVGAGQCGQGRFRVKSRTERSSGQGRRFSKRDSRGRYSVAKC